MIGDCDECGHSIAYHVPLAGCIKCDCDEFRITRLALLTLLALLIGAGQ